MKFIRQGDRLVIEERWLKQFDRPGLLFWIYRLKLIAVILLLWSIFLELNVSITVSVTVAATAAVAMMVLLATIRSLRFRKGSPRGEIALRLGPIVFHRKIFEMEAVKVSQWHNISTKFRLKHQISEFQLRLVSPKAESVTLMRSWTPDAFPELERIGAEIAQFIQVPMHGIETPESMGRP